MGHIGEGKQDSLQAGYDEKFIQLKEENQFGSYWNAPREDMKVIISRNLLLS
jgi:hypothetical protein